MNLVKNSWGTHLWQKGYTIQDLFTCPVKYGSRRYAVAIFDLTGQEWMISHNEYETVEAAMSASIDQVIKMKMALTELKITYQLQAAGLLSPQEVDKIERAVWQW